MANKDSISPLFWLLALGSGVLLYLYSKNSATTGSSILDVINNYEQGKDYTVEDNSGITSDPSTWPKGDKIWNICRAIALAEGANIPGSNPDKLNNPGDISDGAVTFAYLVPEFHSGSVITHFPDKATGWQWLYNKVKNHISGDSAVYPANLSVLAFAQKYAGNWQNWVSNVSRYLNISDPSSITFSQYVNS